MPETLFLSVTLFDRYLSQVIIKKNEMQLVGLTALLLASKYEDFWHPRVSIIMFDFYLFWHYTCSMKVRLIRNCGIHWKQVKDLISISAESYSREQMLQMVQFDIYFLQFHLAFLKVYSAFEVAGWGCRKNIIFHQSFSTVEVTQSGIVLGFLIFCVTYYALLSDALTNWTNWY